MHYVRRISTPLLASLLGAACFAGPDRPQPRPVTPPPQISFFPFIGQDVAAPAMRIRLRPAPNGEVLALALGKLSNRELKDLQDGDESTSLRERLVPFLVWSEEDALVVAPNRWIDAGESLTIASLTSSWTHSFRVEDPEALPRLARVWPPADHGSAGTFAVWCLQLPATGLAASAATTVALEPGHVRGRLRTGSLEGIGHDCVSWEALEPTTQALVPPPMVLLDDGRAARIDPTPIEPSWVEEDSGIQSCSEGLVPLGPACARVMDDRLELSANAGAWWLALKLGATVRAGVLGPGMAMMWRDLQPETELPWEVWGIGLRGDKRAWRGSLRTRAPMAHVVINEVMANPSGTEPQQEWVELYNDGASGVELEGWIFEDPGGEAIVPSARLEPGRFALLVNEGFREDSWPDPAPAVGTLILRVAKLGNQGLSNGGEPLLLREPGGRISSGFPPRASPKPGQSIARLSPDAVDWLEGSFVTSTSSTPGAPNKL